MDDIDALIAFWRARLDEEEAAALAAGDDETARTWSCFDIGGYPVIGAGVDDGWGVTIAGPPAPSEAQVRHIARHDPARTLREIAADRALLAAYAKVAACVTADPEPEFAVGRAVGLDEAVRLRAAIHSDHPDCRPEWARGA
jgi:hypothetical protein